jgi:hypothetical protein
VYTPAKWVAGLARRRVTSTRPLVLAILRCVVAWMLAVPALGEP